MKNDMRMLEDRFLTFRNKILAFHAQMRNKRNIFHFKNQIFPSAFKPLKVTMKQLRLKAGDVREELSGYAQKNTAEWFAECFAEYMDSPTPRLMCKECMYQLRKLLRKQYYQGCVDILNRYEAGRKAS